MRRYGEKRNFTRTSEPKPVRAARAGRSFVIQKHWASRLHYDFRLEHDGVLLSWAVPKGPSFDPAEKRMAVHVEDHPVSYGGFEGTIPPKQYGAGKVIVWDQGTWEPLADPSEGMRHGKLVFRLHGQKLAGVWELVRISKPGDKDDQWFLFKKRDEWAQPLAEYDVIAALPDSVLQQPLGLREERESPPKAASTTRRPSAAANDEPDLANAKRAKLPAKLAPQLATLVSSVPTTGDWLAETKFDGYRLMMRIERGKPRLITRNGHDWTGKLEPVAAAVEGLGIEDGWLDGEIVVLDAKGVPDFNALQNAIDNARTGGIVYFLFDVPFLGDRDLRAVPLASRRMVLQRVFDAAGDQLDSERVRFSPTIEAAPQDLLQAACRLNLEGIMLKRADSSYVGERSATWVKLKCQLRQEFVIVGFNDRTNAPGEVGGLLLGYNEGGALRYAGSVGTGWNSATGRDLYQRLLPLKVKTPAVDAATVTPGRWSTRKAGTDHWVRPELVCEVTFTEWTPEGRIRHPSFQGLRSDKPPGMVTRESPASVSAAQALKTRSRAPSIKISNPDRVIDPSTGFRKLGLVHYYESIADWMLPHLKRRPVSLVRAPQGITGQLFFQKHPQTKMPGLKELDPALWPGHTALLEVDTPAALVAAAQMNVVEFHTWNSTTRSIDKPDRVIFDLDPGEGVAWAKLQEAALLMRTLLAELGLDAWLKTSGGKGLHVVVPLAPKLDYEVVKGFSQAAVQHLARTIPSRFVAKSGANNRVGKIFVDYLRNGHSQTTAAAFSARAGPGMGVSMPVSWESLKDLKSGAMWSIATAREYLSFQSADPWAGYWKSRQTLTKAIKALAG
ncbi:MAG TPA: DNA ligase D [Aquabacterium sp.]|nr:DNA ligase D [Aquabacterium sp.]